MKPGRLTSESMLLTVTFSALWKWKEWIILSVTADRSTYSLRSGFWNLMQVVEGGWVRGAPCLLDESKFSEVKSVQLLSRIRLFANPWTMAHQASLSITNSRSLPKPMSFESVIPSSHLILCHRFLLLPSVFPNIRVFSDESALRIRWPKCWSFSFNISPSNEPQDWSPLGWTGWISLQSQGLSSVFSNTAVQKHQFFSAQLSL